MLHTDVPLPQRSRLSRHSYVPSAIATLSYLATTIFTLHNAHHLLAKKRATEKSLPEPLFGLEEDKEGTLIGLLKGGSHNEITRPDLVKLRGIVVEAEFRRRSGRGVKEWFYLSHFRENEVGVETSKSRNILLDDHPLFSPAAASNESHNEDNGDEQGSTFDLSITEKQRRDREGVVLPYFDAQRGPEESTSGEGGRIVYEMGVEDDFDEEEDEL